MTTLIICLAIATAMPILFKAPLAFAMNQLGGCYDNRHPRAQQSQLSGFGARAKAVHENSFEALIMFAPGALTAIATNQVGNIAQYLAITFVIARFAYALSYWFDVHILRSSVWFIGFGCSLGLFFVAL